MTGGAIISMLIGLALPALVAVVTRESMPMVLREGLLLLLATATGAISSVASNPPTSLSGWEHLALNILVTFATAEASSFTQHKAGAIRALHTATDKHFGLGHYDPNLVVAA